MIMRKFIYVFAALVLSVAASAQSIDYLRRYNLLLDRVGPAGVGMETLIENWGKAEPESIEMLQARFFFLLTKAQGSEVVSRKESKFLGLTPVLTLKDSLGTDVHYYEVIKYEEGLFVDAVESLQQAISISPDRLDLRFLMANTYMSYERENIDLTLSNIMGLVHDYMSSGKKWLYQPDFASEPEEVDKEQFADMMKDYCYSFYTLATPSSYDAFLKLSERMNSYFKKDADFIGNIGSYHHVVKQDYKTALKYYDKAIKLQPDNTSLINNALIAARKMNNAKLEKKYRKMLEK